MSTPVILILAFAFAAFAGAMIEYYRKLEAVRLENLQCYSDKFAMAFDLILTSERELPLRLLNDISFWNELVADKRLSERVAVVILARGFLRKKNPGERIHALEVSEFLTSHPNTYANFILVRIYALAIACFRGRFFGLTAGPSLNIFLDHLLDAKNEEEADTFAYSVRRKLDRRKRGFIHDELNAPA